MKIATFPQTIPVTQQNRNFASQDSKKMSDQDPHHGQIDQNNQPKDQRASEQIQKSPLPAQQTAEDTLPQPSETSLWATLPKAGPPPFKSSEFPQYLEHEVLDILKERMRQNKSIFEMWPSLPPVRVLHERLAYDAMIRSKIIDHIEFRGQSRADNPELIELFRKKAYEKDAAWRQWDRQRIAWIDDVRQERLYFWSTFDFIQGRFKEKADNNYVYRQDFFQQRFENVENAKDMRRFLNEIREASLQKRYDIFWDMVAKGLEKHRHHIPYSGRSIEDLLRWLPDVPNKSPLIQAIEVIKLNREISAAEQIMDHANSRAVSNAVWFHDFSFVKAENTVEQFQDYLYDLKKRDLYEIYMIRDHRNHETMEHFDEAMYDTLYQINQYWDLWDLKNQPLQHAVSVFGSNRSAIHGLFETGNKSRIQFAMELNKQNLDFIRADQIFARHPGTNNVDILYHTQIFDSYSKMLDDRYQRKIDNEKVDIKADYHKHFLTDQHRATMIGRNIAEYEKNVEGIELKRQENTDRQNYYVDVLTAPWSGQNQFFSTRAQEHEEQEIIFHELLTSDINKLQESRHTSSLHDKYDKEHVAYYMSRKMADFDGIDNISLVRKDSQNIISQERNHVDSDVNAYQNADKQAVGFHRALHHAEFRAHHSQENEIVVNLAFHYETKTQAHPYSAPQEQYYEDQDLSSFPTENNDLKTFAQATVDTPRNPEATKGIQLYAGLEMQNQLYHNSPPPDPLSKANDESEVTRQRDVAKIRFFETTREYPTKPMNPEGLVEQKKPKKPL